MTYLPPGDPRHGKRATYSRLGCRCSACADATAVYQRELRAARRGRPLAADDPRHGKATTYKNWACRCQACTEAQASWDAQYYERVKAERSAD